MFWLLPSHENEKPLQKLRMDNDRLPSSPKLTDLRSHELPLVSFSDISTKDLLNYVFLDVRAPCEYAEGHPPTSFNFPLMNDEERHYVGKCFVQKGRDAAILLGHQLVFGDTKEERIEKWKEFVTSNDTQNKNILLYCFRGGLRSQISQNWIFETTNHMIPRVDGGYKAIRKFFSRQLEEICQSTKFVLIGGRTGSGKTEVLVQEETIVNIDLEGLAKHRGSAFGAHDEDPQPRQATFEMSVSYALLQAIQSKPKFIVLENEGSMIGMVDLPSPLIHAMSKSPIIVLESPTEDRMARITDEYVTVPVAKYGNNVVRERILTNIDRIQRRFGKKKHAKARELAEAAFDGSISHGGWVRFLLEEYYDPLYNRGLKKYKDRIVHVGDREDVVRWLLDPPPNWCSLPEKAPDS